MAQETPDFQANSGADPPHFANEAEVECARILDYHGIAWEYEPHSFVLEQDENGRVLEAFTPEGDDGKLVDVAVKNPDGKTAIQKRAFQFDARYRS